MHIGWRKEWDLMELGALQVRFALMLQMISSLPVRWKQYVARQSHTHVLRRLRTW